MDSSLLLKSAVIWDVAMFEQYPETVYSNRYREGTANDLYPNDSERTGYMNAISKDTTHPRQTFQWTAQTTKLRHYLKGDTGQRTDY